MTRANQIKRIFHKVPAEFTVDDVYEAMEGSMTTKNISESLSDMAARKIITRIKPGSHNGKDRAIFKLPEDYIFTGIPQWVPIWRRIGIEFQFG